MSNLNQHFFNEYAKLDKLCRDSYYNHLPEDEIKGVTNYINDMKNTPSHISRTVTDWDEWLHALVHIRHIRNQLAHEPGHLKKLSVLKTILIGYIIFIEASLNIPTLYHKLVRTFKRQTPPRKKAHQKTITITKTKEEDPRKRKVLFVHFLIYYYGQFSH